MEFYGEVSTFRDLNLRNFTSFSDISPVTHATRTKSRVGYLNNTNLSFRWSVLLVGPHLADYNKNSDFEEKNNS